MSPEIESWPIFQEFGADHILVSPNNSPQRVARISSTCQQEPQQRQIFAPRYGTPEWSGPKISFVLVHRSFDFQIGTSLSSARRACPFGRKCSFYGSVGGDTGQETAWPDRVCAR
jgi:hypothetical protein